MADRTGDPALLSLAERLGRRQPAERQLVDRVLDTLLADPVEPATTAVVRTERLEVVDGVGRVRVVVGNLSPSGNDEAYLPGVGLRDAEGGERAALLVLETVPVLGFTLADDDALVLGVDDATAAATAGPYVELLAGSGAVAVGWRIRDGALHHREPVATRPG